MSYQIELAGDPILDCHTEQSRMILKVGGKTIGCWWAGVEGYQALIFSTEQEVGPVDNDEDFIRAIESALTLIGWYHS